jgi:predicted enzyme related to lactoylglutathione lyase
MFTVTKYPHGTFCWADCASTDVAKARSFYETVMGWTSNDIPIGDGMMYTMFQKDGKTVAAISQMQPEMQSQGIPSHWMNYINVEDVDALVDKIKELGGTVLVEPMDVFEEGRMLVLQDPTGAQVSLWEAKNHIGASLVNTPGAITWNELYTPDIDKAKKFYSDLLGWEYDVDEPSGYLSITNKGRGNGGVMALTEAMGDMPPNWTVYFSVEDIDATIEKAQANGGTVMMPKTDAAGIGHFTVIADPAGATAIYMQLKEPEPWKE